ncbi:MAG TPA: hypothetical protein VK539_25075 [Myxococcaceae bacterium]|nr:hypothetical protein [Myxococcaceae bacterium]
MNRLSRYGLLLALPVLLLSHSAAAQAPASERIALHPCVITGGKKADTSDIEAICTTAAIRPTMDLVPSVDVLKFFQDEACATTKDRAACVEKLNAAAKGARPREMKTCAKAKNRDACLGRLAAATQASRTLYITLNPYTPKMTRITGIVVDATGKRVEDRSLELPRLASQSPSDAVRYAVGQLLDKLEVARAPLAEVLPPSLTPTAEPEPLFVQPPSAEPTPPPAATPTPAPAPVLTQAPPPPPGRTWKTPAGITGMALGAVGLGVAGYFVTSSNKDAKTFNDGYANGLPLQSQLPALAEARDDARSKRSTATLSAGAGGALLVGGAILFLIDRPSDAPKEKTAGTTRILAGPGQVGILVVLP